MSDKADVIICGAGSAGVAVAYYLAKDHGVTDVVVVDKHPPLSQTSAKSGENYRNWWPAETMAAISNRSIDLMEALALSSDNVFNMTRRGYVYASTKSWDAEEIDQYIRSHSHENIGPVRIHRNPDGAADLRYTPPAEGGYQNQPDGADVLEDATQIRNTFPHLSGDVRLVFHARRCGAVSAQQLGNYLLTEAKKLGARELRGEVVSIERDKQGVSAVEVVTQTGKIRIETRHFVNASGPFVPSVSSMVDVEVPVYSVFQQKITFPDHLGVVPRSAPFTIFMDAQHLDWSEEEEALFRSEPGYRWLLEPFPGGVHIRPEGGDDSPWIKLGWAFNATAEAPVWERELIPEFPDVVLRGASRLVPGLKKYYDRIPQPVVHYGGYYTKTKENLPVIGPLGVNGAFVVGALSGFGTMVSCAAGELTAAWVTGSPLPGYARDMSPERFQDPEYARKIKDIKPEGEL
jgi:glycine/D-amino acid oxidase-like deaminating enzyme